MLLAGFVFFISSGLRASIPTLLGRSVCRKMSVEKMSKKCRKGGFMSLKVWFYSREGRDDDPLPEGEGISFLSSGTKIQGVSLSVGRKF